MKKTATKADIYQKNTVTLADVKVGDNLSGVTLYFEGVYPNATGRGWITFNEKTSDYMGGEYAGISYDSSQKVFGYYKPSFGTINFVAKFFEYDENGNGTNIGSYTFPEVQDDSLVVTAAFYLTENAHFAASVIQKGVTADCEFNYNAIQEVKNSVKNFASEEYVQNAVSTKADVYYNTKTLGNLKVGDDLSGVTITWDTIDKSNLITGMGIAFGGITTNPNEDPVGAYYIIGTYPNGVFGIYEGNDPFGSQYTLKQSFEDGPGSYTFGNVGFITDIFSPALSDAYNKIVITPGDKIDCEYNYKNKADILTIRGKTLADVKVGDNLSGVTLYFDDFHSSYGANAQIIFNEHTEYSDGIKYYSCIKADEDNTQYGDDWSTEYQPVVFGYWKFGSALGATLYPSVIFCSHEYGANHWLRSSYTFPTVDDDRYVIREIVGDLANDAHYQRIGLEPLTKVDVEYNYNSIKELETAAENKVDKTNTAWRLYGTSQEGIQRAIPYAFSQDTPSSIPMRDYKGRLFAQTNDEPINDPTLMDADYQLVNLKYVKENIPVEKGASAGSVQQKAAAAGTGITVDYSNDTGTITVGSDVPAGTEFDIVGYSKNKEYSYRQHVKVGETLTIPECKSFVPDIERNGVDIDVAKPYTTLDLRDYGVFELETNSINSASIGDINLMGYIELAEGAKGIFNLDTSALYKKIWGKKTLTLSIANNNIGVDLLNKHTTYQIPVYIFYGITTADELSFRNQDADGKLGLERYVTMLPDTVNSEGVTVKHHICEGNFRLMNDIDFKGTAENINYPQLGLWSQNLDGTGATGWNYRFKGVFDGCGYTMKNISMYQVNNRGLIACISSEGVVKNLFLDNVLMKGNLGYTDVMSGAVCTSNYGLIKNVYVFGYMNIPTSQDWAPPAFICAKNDNGIITDCGVVVLNNDILPENYGNAITRSEGNSASHCISLKLEGHPILATSIVERDEATKTIHVPDQPANITYYGRAKQIKRQLSTDRVPSDLSFQSFEDFEMFLKYGYDEYNTYGRNALGMRDLLDKVAKFALSNGIIDAASTTTFTTNKNIISTVAIEYPATAAANSAQSVALGDGTIANGEGVAALGRYNEGDDNNILEVGVGSAQDRKTAFAITNDGRAQVSALPSGPNDVVNLAHLNNRYRHLITISFDPSTNTTYGSNKFTFKTIVENDNKFPLTDFGYFFNEVESKGKWTIAGECSVNGTNYGTGYLTVTRPAITDTIATYSNLFNFTLQLTGSAGNSTITLKYVDTTVVFGMSDITMKIGGFAQ